jgi:hypothetical protein
MNMSTNRFRTFLGACLIALLAALPALAQSAPPKAQEQYIKVYVRVVGDQRQPLQKRIATVGMLEQLGPRARSAAPVLLKALRYNGPMWVRVPQPPPPPCVFDPSWVPERVFFKGSELRLAALKALVKIGPETRPFVTTLVESLEDLPQLYKNSQRETAAVLEDKFPEVIAAALNRLGAETCRVLAGHGPRAREALPVLIEIASGEFRKAEKPGTVPGETESALGGGEKEAPADKEVKWLDRSCRQAAIEAVAAIASDRDTEAIDALDSIAALDPDRALRRAAARAAQIVRNRKSAGVKEGRDVKP